MEKLPRNVEIDYSKYAPDIPEDQLETYYGLPQKVQFCKECVMSNQILRMAGMRKSVNIMSSG